MSQTRSVSEYSSGDFGFRLKSYSRSAVQPHHRHDRPSISLVLRGGVQENVDACTRRGQALSIVYKPAGTLHANRYGEQGALLLQIEFSSQGFIPPDLPWHWSHARRSLRSFLHLARMFHAECGSKEELLAATGNVLRSLSPNASRDPVPAWLSKTRKAVLEASCRTDLRVDHLASQLHIHPVYLTRQFRRHYGETIRECISRKRIIAAAVVMAETSQKLTEIAYSLGYADQAHFSRDFRNHTGLRPCEFRQLAHL